MNMNDFSDARLNCEETINICYEFFVANPVLLFIMMFCCMYAL